VKRAELLRPQLDLNALESIVASYVSDTAVGMAFANGWPKSHFAVSQAVKLALSRVDTKSFAKQGVIVGRRGMLPWLVVD